MQVAQASNSGAAAHIDAPHAARAHPAWVRLTHALIALSVLTLMLSGFFILMVHPRLYWGEVGNDLTPALIELPISRNHRHGGWAPAEPFDAIPGTPVSAVRTFEIFNQNGWARSLHFLAAWCLVAALALYLVRALLGGHLWRNLMPRLAELHPRRLWADLSAHLRLRIASSTGPPYGLLQKCSYAAVVLVLLPLAVVTGLAMSPEVRAAFPILSDAWGGSQSARTVHFVVFALLVLFLLAHVLMVVLSGFRRQLRAMTIGGNDG